MCVDVVIATVDCEQSHAAQEMFPRSLARLISLACLISRVFHISRVSSFARLISLARLISRVSDLARLIPHVIPCLDEGLRCYHTRGKK